MYTYVKKDKRALAGKWFLLAAIFGGLFLAFTVIYATGVLDMAVLMAERWIIGRPLLQFDCVLVEWRNLGSAPVSLLSIVLLGVLCGLTRYRWRVLPYLIILVLIGTATEMLGKNLPLQLLPPVIRSGMVGLTCPQIGHSRLLQLQLNLGMWWKAPLPNLGVQSWSHAVSLMPINISSGRLEDSRSFPSGHAIRWWFIGLLLAWLFWRHVKPLVVRWLLVVLTLTLSFIGAAIQFYVGVHFISDTIAGYFLGTALACVAIGLLIVNAREVRPACNQSSIVKTALKSAKPI